MAGRILIVDDVATNRIVLKVKLAEAQYQPLVAASAASCLAIVRDSMPDLILIDRLLPDMDGIEVVRQLRADPATRNISIILMLRDGEADMRLAGLRAGADDVMTKPIDDHRLMARIRSLLRARENAEDLRTSDATLGAIGLAEAGSVFDRAGVVALVTGRPETAMQLRATLAPLLRDRLIILSRDEALGDVRVRSGRVPDLFLIGTDLAGDGGGLRLISDLRSRGGSRHAAICLLMPDVGAAQAAMAFDLGADDVVPDTADPRETALRLRRLLRLKCREDRLRATVSDGLRLAIIDPLTGLYNRRYALAELGRILERARKSGTAVAVMVVDLDRFKAVNDAFGHAAGDDVLVEVAQRLGANLRTGDLLARIGGEEFLVALPDTDLADASRLAERLCRAVEEQRIRINDRTALSVTVSIGLATTVQPDAAGPEAVASIVGRADHALLGAKADGRNKVTISRTAA